MTDDECPCFAFSSESVVSQNESVVDRWLKEREDGPHDWSERLAMLRVQLRDRMHVVKMTLLRRLFAIAGRRIGTFVARAPMRCAAGSAASLSGVIVGMWAMFFPTTPTDPQPRPELPALTSTASSEIAPELCPSQSTADSAALPATPRPLVEDSHARLAPGRPSPFYVDPDVDRADYETDDPERDHIAPVSFPATADDRPAVWLEGTIEDIPAPAFPEPPGDPSPSFPQRRITEPVRATRAPIESGPSLVIQPR